MKFSQLLDRIALRTSRFLPARRCGTFTVTTQKRLFRPLVCDTLHVEQGGRLFLGDVTVNTLFLDGTLTVSGQMHVSGGSIVIKNNAPSSLTFGLTLDGDVPPRSAKIVIHVGSRELLLEV